MLPSYWTSTYNYQYRDADSRLIAPHQGEAMYHYNGHYDPSHYQRQHGFYAQRAITANETRSQSASLGGGLSSARRTSPAATIAAHNTLSFNRSAPVSSTSSDYASGSSTSRRVPGSYHSLEKFDNLPVVNTSRGNKDLWTHPILPHSGVYSNDVHIPTSTNRIAGLANWEQTSTTRNQQLRNDGERYHIPGYSGFIRGIQFSQGDTYGKTTRRCLDVPTDVPLEP